MTIAITSLDVKRAINKELHDKFQIHFETTEKLITVIVAAEENLSDLYHTYILSDDGDGTSWIEATCPCGDR